MRIELLPGTFTICQLNSLEGVDWAAPCTFFARTEEEISLVCPGDKCPAGAMRRAEGWRCFRVAGPLDFSLTGILAQLAGCLAQAETPIFALSTYNTDYILVQAAHLERARKALAGAGHEILTK